MFQSIPGVITPAYPVPDLSGIQGVQVGRSVRDVVDGQPTTKSRAYDAGCASEGARFAAANIQYTADLAQAEAGKATALGQIDAPLRKKIIAITLLVICIIAVIGAVIGALVTHLWPILFFVIPGIIGLIPTSYYTHIFSNKVADLQEAIDLPSNLRGPILKLPYYDVSGDLELRGVRETKMNALRSSFICQLTQESIQDIVNYALLDRVTDIIIENKPIFYAKCVELIRAHREVVRANKTDVSTIRNTVNTLSTELRRWKEREEEGLNQQEILLDRVERQRQELQTQRAEQPRKARSIGESFVRGLEGASDIWTRVRIQERRAEVAESARLRTVEIARWEATSTEKVRVAFETAIRHIEELYQGSIAYASSYVA